LGTGLLLRGLEESSEESSEESESDSSSEESNSFFDFADIIVEKRTANYCLSISMLLERLSSRASASFFLSKSILVSKSTPDIFSGWRMTPTIAV